MKERLSKNTAGDQKRRLLGSKVLNLFKKICVQDSSMTLKLVVISRLFALLEKLVHEMDDFAETIYSLLVFFLIEFHDNKIVRQHLMSNFTDLYN